MNKMETSEFSTVTVPANLRESRCTVSHQAPKQPRLHVAKFFVNKVLYGEKKVSY